MSRTIAIVDYGAGNLRSVAKAFERLADEAGLGAHATTVTSDPRVVAAADRIVLPGDGAFANCWRSLNTIDGLVEALREAVEIKARPFFGICVGMQLMATHGLEHGDHPGFGWIPSTVDRLKPADPHLKIPHMGWNDLEFHRSHPVCAQAQTGDHAYFVHSYALACDQPQDHLVATVDYEGAVTAVIAKDTLFGTQFHPEKSQSLGLGLIASFLEWRP